MWPAVPAGAVWPGAPPAAPHHGDQGPPGDGQCTKVREDFTITKTDPPKAFSLLKAPSSTFRRLASNGLLNLVSPCSKNIQAILRIFADQTACQLWIDGQKYAAKYCCHLYSQPAARNLHFLLFRVCV